jgi:hypothetical protein
MQPYEKGPRRKDVRKMNTDRIVRETERLLQETAQMARQAGQHLHAVTICTSFMCRCVHGGYYAQCPNNAPTVNGEVSCNTFHALTSVWN